MTATNCGLTGMPRRGNRHAGEARRWCSAVDLAAIHRARRMNFSPPEVAPRGHSDGVEPVCLRKHHNDASSMLIFGDRLYFLHRNSMRIGEVIVANSANLPGNF